MMMRTLKSGLTIGMLVAALAMTAGCGDNDNSSDNGNDNGSPNPNPTRTATPGPNPTETPGGGGNPTATPTATPGQGEATVTFNVAASEAAQGFDLQVAYPTDKGGFRGSADSVACSTTSGGSFVPNDLDNGTLRLVVGNATNLTFPYTITCTFDATSTVTASDFQVTVRSVVQNGVDGDPTILTVTPSVS